jgi:hypothetical protein
MTQPTCETCRFWRQIKPPGDATRFNACINLTSPKCGTHTGWRDSCADYQPAQQKEAE